VALVLEPATPIHDAVQTIRRKHDKHFDRWMPHINLYATRPAKAPTQPQPRMALFIRITLFQVDMFGSELCQLLDPPISSNQHQCPMPSSPTQSICLRWIPVIHTARRLYPFVPEEEFPVAAGRLGAVLRAGIAPFTVRMERIVNFEHGKRSFTAWLAPQAPGDGTCQAQRAYSRECIPRSRHIH
jgi:hypothetical protein